MNLFNVQVEKKNASCFANPWLDVWQPSGTFFLAFSASLDKDAKKKGQTCTKGLYVAYNSFCRARTSSWMCHWFTLALIPGEQLIFKVATSWHICRSIEFWHTVTVVLKTWCAASLESLWKWDINRSRELHCYSEYAQHKKPTQSEPCMLPTVCSVWHGFFLQKCDSDVMFIKELHSMPVLSPYDIWYDCLKNNSIIVGILSLQDWMCNKHCLWATSFHEKWQLV